MRIFPAGSTPWLLAHELRLAWRGFGSGGRSRRGPILLGAIIAIPTLAVGVLIASLLSQVRIPDRPEVALGVDAVLLFIFTLMLSGTIAQATQVFFQRGDLDLLLSSPLPARRVLTARCVGMAVNAAALFLILVTPMTLPTILFGHPEWLTVYPTLIAFSLLATVIGLATAVSLFALIGPRATRTLAQVLAAVIGAGFYAVTQLARFWIRDHQHEFTDRYEALVGTGLFSPGQPLAWPAEALTGHALPAFGLLGGALVLFLLTVNAVGGRFARNAAAAAGLGAPGRKARGRVRGFKGGPFQAMLRKELRLMRRDVVLLSQVLLRLIYLIVLCFVLWKSLGGFGGTPAPALAGAVAFIGGQLGAIFAWITMSGEEGIELLASSPAKAPVLRRAKLVAAMVPVALLLVLPLGAIAWTSPRIGAITAGGCLCAAVSAGLIAIWYERPAPRSDFRRRRNASLIAAFAEFIMGLLWAGATAMAAGPWPMLAAAPIILAGVALLALRRPQRSFAEVLQAK